MQTKLVHRIGRNSDRIQDNTTAFQQAMVNRQKLREESASPDYDLAQRQEAVKKAAAFRRMQEAAEAFLAVIVCIILGAALAGFFL
jgi:hypothetical protein